jgi:MFS transporter, DHA2 family, multidrug resistance protein
MDAPAASAADRIDPRRLIAFMAMCFGMFMALLDLHDESSDFT